MEGIKQGFLPLVALLALVAGLMIGDVVEGATVVPRNRLVRQYYKKTNSCRSAEAFVKHQVKLFWQHDKSVTPKLLRLLYSDCMVTIVLDAYCPGVVSCADILQLATRDAVAMAGGPSYIVLTGRKDGMSSKASSVDLPSPYISEAKARQYFEERGLDVQDLTTLLGAHSMGKARCRYVRDRLYNFQGSGRADPIMDASKVEELRKQCPETYKPGEHEAQVFLDKESEYSFSNSYYQNILAKKAVLRIDQNFLYGNETFELSQQFGDSANEGLEDFKKAFAFSMARLGNYKVLVGSQGEIRKNCHFTNSKY
ncbi:putative peroxidase 61 [Bienertia sinuspersici]